MSDFLLELGRRPAARKVVGALGVPLPQRLDRDASPWSERPLHDRTVVVYSGGDLGKALGGTLTRAGANCWVQGDTAPFLETGEAWGRRPRTLEGNAQPDTKPHALVFDATRLDTPDDLRALYDFFKPRIKTLRRCGRIVVLGRPPTDPTPARAAAQHALDGFMRSAAKEVGRKGATANLITVEEGAEERLAPVLQFLLSPRSAFVSGQALQVCGRVAQTEDVPLVRPLQGRTALVTGAARGIGASIARALAREGAHVFCLDRPADDEPLSRVAAEVGGTPVACDVTDPDAAAKISAALGSRGLDILVNNAGVTRDKTLGNMDEARWDMTIAINLTAVIRLTESLPLTDNARVICLSSIAGIAGNFGQTNYSASKSGIIGFVESAGPLLAPRGIAINAIAPGFIETRLTKAIPTATREVARRLSNLSQGGLPADIAEVATFLSSPGAAGLCGNVIRVCGGNLVGA